MKVNCPTCKKEIEWSEVPTRPFCSDRCRLIDLGDWASEKYAVPDEHSHPPAPTSGKKPEEENDED
jgi:endogenous inhibitor of DNA gyrase (YacG/DUF329 family)